MTRGRPLWTAVLLGLLGCAAAMAACSGPPPTSTPTPLPAQPPRVVFRVPERGQELAIDAPIVLSFDQPMDRASVQSAFVVSPTVQGSFEWQGNRMRFAPEAGGFARATVYRVALGSSSRNATGQTLPESFSFQFATVGNLEVTTVQPANGAANVAQDAAITVMFNRPVVPLTAVGVAPASPALLTSASFDPPGPQGDGDWLNTSIYTFRPRAGQLFSPGTTYTIRISSGLTDTTGGLLPRDFTWQFTSELPKAIQFACNDPERFVGPSPAISITFNIPMRHESVEQRLTLRARGAADTVPVSVHWSGTTATFTPSVALRADTDYTIAVAAGVQGGGGGAGSAQDAQWNIHTAPPPAVVRTFPVDGARAAEPYTSLEVSFSCPMQRDSILPNLTILPTATEVYTSWDELSTQLYLSFGARPSTEYTIVFGPNAESRYGQRLGRPYRIEFTTGPLPPSMLPPASRVGTCNAYTTTSAYIQHVNVGELNLSLFRLSRREFLELNGSQWWERWENLRPSEASLVRHWRSRVQSRLNSYESSLIPLSGDGRSPLPPGIYYLRATAEGVSSAWQQMLVVSRANLTLKVGRGEALVWIADLGSGRGLAGLDVSLYAATGQVLASGRTDADGIAFGRWSDDTGAESERANPWDPVMAVAGSDDDPIVASTDWSSGISPWQFDLALELSPQPYRAHFYTDRQIYRPGQTVFFKGILRGDDDGRYSLPDGIAAITLTVQDNAGKEIYRSGLPVSDLGSVHGEVRLAAEAGLGFYSVSTRIGESVFGTGFQVAEYRKPEFEVSVATNRQEYTLGEEIALQVGASYYFGGPVANSKVTWRLMSEDYYFNWTGSRRYSFTDPDYESRRNEKAFGELVSSGSGRTDAMGRFALSLPADIRARKNSQVFTLETSVTDPSNQEVSGRTSVIVHKGQFYVGLAPREYIGTVGQQCLVDVITIDPQGAPVPSVLLSAVFLEQRWYNVQQQSEDGHYYWDWTLQEIATYTTTLTTDREGSAVVAFTPEKGGSYRVRAFARDAHENEIRSSTYVWISSAEYIPWRQENSDRIELVSDKESYRIGETARILVPSPYQGSARALVTVERGRVVSHQLLTLETNSTQLEIPILSEHVPNIYVSVFLLKAADEFNAVASQKVGYLTLAVSTLAKELAIQITPDRAGPYEPGGEASFEVRATDYLGRPVSAEFSLQLVDASVLALTGDMQGTLLDQFYRQRPLGIRTASSLTVSVDRERQRAPSPSGKGGSGSERQGLVRSRFPDTAFWSADLRTDAQGVARYTIELPDNLTTWRATAKAVTADTLVGRGDASIVTNKDLMIRPVAPRFFVVGDQVQLSAVVHNNTDRLLVTSVSLDARGLGVTGPSAQVEIPGGGSTTVDWHADVLAAPSAVITWRAASGALADAVELTLPVYTFSTPEVVATAGQVSSGESRTEVVLLPESLDLAQGELTVQVDPSLAAGMQDALKYLEAYPYDCIEQTVSRFLPNVTTYRALEKLGVANRELEARLPQYIGVGLQRIYALQHYDGGWGWWLADESHPFISAYVLLGMTEADKAGFSIDRDVMDRAARFLQGALDSTQSTLPAQANSRALVLYALAEFGAGDLGRTNALFERRESLGVCGKAWLAMTLAALTQGGSPHAMTLVSDLTTAAILSATGAHWEEENTDYWTMSTNTRSTAVVLRALVRVDPGNALLPNAVRWLMTARKEGHWETTQETAWSVLALTDFMASTGELEADYNFRVALNGKSIGEGTITAQNVAISRRFSTAVSSLLRDAGNRVMLERPLPIGPQTGRGQLYYSAYLRYFKPVNEVVALNRGIIVSRRYALWESPKQAVSHVGVGDVIQVKLTMIAPTDLHYVVLEDPLPSGCEALDTSLKTTSLLAAAAELTRADELAPYWWYFSETQLRDEKVALFATYLSRGTYEYTYLIRASIPGRFLTLPANAYEMYFPEVFGRSDGGVLEIEP